jgi:hypothetical protein
MSFFVFVGDPKHDGHGARRIEMFGKTFNRLTGTEVTDAAQVTKLRGNPHFKEVGSGESFVVEHDGTQALPTPASAPIGDDERARMNAAFDVLAQERDAARQLAAEAEGRIAALSEHLTAALARAEAAEARAKQAEDMLEALTGPNGGDQSGDQGQ